MCIRDRALAALLMAFSLAAGIPSEAAENYRIGIGKDQTVKADQTVTLDVTVAAPGGTFNTADLTFSYEKEYLTFDQKASTGLDLSLIHICSERRDTGRTNHRTDCGSGSSGRTGGTGCSRGS